MNLKVHFVFFRNAVIFISRPHISCLWLLTKTGFKLIGKCADKMQKESKSLIVAAKYFKITTAAEHL